MLDKFLGLVVVMAVAAMVFWVFFFFIKKKCWLFGLIFGKMKNNI